MNGDPINGTSIARPSSMARRITALVGIVIVLILVTVLMLQVYEHHRSAAPREDTTIVEFATVRPVA